MHFDEDLAKAVALQIGVEITNLLGTGYYGKAYKLKDGRVLKLTRDKSEYAISFDLQGKNYEHIVKVFNTYKFVTIHEESFYVIIRDYLEQLQEFNFFDAKTYFTHTLRHAFEGVLTMEEADEKTEVLRKTYPQYLDWINQCWELFWECKDAGFERIDIGTPNLGFKGGTLQLLDAGWNGKELTFRPKEILLKEYGTV